MTPSPSDNYWSAKQVQAYYNLENRFQAYRLMKLVNQYKIPHKVVIPRELIAAVELTKITCAMEKKIEAQTFSFKLRRKVA